MTIDYSTLNLEALRQQGKVTRFALDHKHYHLQEDPGNGCIGDPPGYPTYFTRAVYTARGDEPGGGFSSLVIVDPENGDVFWDVEHVWRKNSTWVTVHAEQQELMRRLYKPLPIDHPRVLAWAIATAVHNRHCYVDPAKGDKRRHCAELLIWPIPGYQLRHFHDDPRFSEEWRSKERAAVDQANAEIVAIARPIATVENSVLMYDMREVYSEITPDTVLAEGVTPRGLLENTPELSRGDWWERHSIRPSPDECQPPKWFGAHHTKGWCQFCGAVAGKQ